jgi:magnesium transporter
MTVDEATRYVRRQALGKAETIYYLYVLDAGQRLLGVLTFRELLTQPGERLVRDVMETDVVTVRDDQDDEAVAAVVSRLDLLAVPVVDAEGRMAGIVTVDDVFDVVQQEATEDIQKLGGMEALDIPYLQTGLLAMLQKRAGWLGLLFLGELLTASAMANFEDEIARAVVLAVFVPLIISSGGNSGSQATTLVIRAMALGEVHLRDGWAIARREVLTGLVLGSILALLGVLRVYGWEAMFGTYGGQVGGVALTVATSLVLVVTLGTLAGSMLPMLLRRAGFDPASASAPFVATLVDVSGLLIYFSVARFMLGL